MKHIISRRGWLVLIGLAGALALVALGGCGGTDIDDDDGYDPGYPDYPRYTNLTLILRVVDPDGYPIGDASVYVDGELDDEETDWEFHPLGSGYPYDWQGWLANWTSDDYRVVLNYPGDRDEFNIEVRKNGYYSDYTTVEISDYEPDEIFVRDVLVLVPRYGIYSQNTEQAKEAEIAPAEEGFKREAGHKPTITLGAEE